MIELNEHEYMCVMVQRINYLCLSMSHIKDLLLIVKTNIISSEIYTFTKLTANAKLMDKLKSDDLIMPYDNR